MSVRNSQGSQDEGKPKEDMLEEVSSTHEGVVIDEATNKRIVRKIDWQLMPIVRTLSLLSGLLRFLYHHLGDLHHAELAIH